MTSLVARLPAGFKACILVVVHLSPEASAGFMVRQFAAAGPLTCSEARDGDPLQVGHIHVAPSDHHLLVDGDHLKVIRGPRENRWRPSIDSLFRSAAVARGSAVIGIVLTGFLNDGTVGLHSIKRCGGISIVQDPDDARQADMPMSALREVETDHCVPVSEMAALLEELLAREPGESPPIPEDLRIEARIAAHALGSVEDLEQVASNRSTLTCPGCGGVLWERNEGGLQRFRCHTGHTYTAESLLDSQEEKIEETLWVALRMFEERRQLLNSMAMKSGNGSIFRERASRTEVHISRLRRMFQSRH